MIFAALRPMLPKTLNRNTALGNDAGLIGCVGEANKNPYSFDYRGYFSR